MIDIDDLPEEIREKVFITEDNLLFLPEGELAAQDVYKKWLENRGKQIDICDEPTAEERITQLEADKEALAQNVYMLAEVLEALLGGEEDGQEESITEDTAS